MTARLMQYKFNEHDLCRELHQYIDRTYGQHYSAGSNTLQTLEEIGKEPLRGFHFCQSNVIKYASRCEHKGTTRQDLIKAAHYSLLAIYHFDQMDKLKEKDLNDITKPLKGGSGSN